MAAPTTPPRADVVRTVSTLADLTPDARNPNRGTPRGTRLLHDSLATCGAGRSVLVDRAGRIIAGNKTVREATTLTLPVTVVQSDGSALVVVQRTDLDLETDTQARTLALADNRIAELDLVWDPELLKAHVDAGLDLSDLWMDEELERLLRQGLRSGHTDPDATAPVRPTSIARGELFALGAHRLLCGDATAPADVQRLLGDVCPHLMTTDPPYGVSYDPSWRVAVDGSPRHALGRVTNDDRVDWTEALACFPGDVAYVWHAGVAAGPVASSLERIGFTIRAQIVWVKQHFALSRGDYHWQHEPCYYAIRTGRSAAFQGDRTQSTV